MTPATVHASAVKIGDRGVLIRGASGSGKSSLLLQILSADPDGSTLVADDRVALAADGARVMATAPDLLAGLMEIRGQGILRLPYVSPAAIDLVVDIVPAEKCPRMPSPEERCVDLCGIATPRIFLARGAVDGGARIRAALSWPLYENA
jgi:serine kinase of HPr protein (carbohydrate metabolism regulator)